MRLPVPADMAAGVVDLRSYGLGLAEVQEADGERYIEVPEDGPIDRVKRAWTASEAYTYPPEEDSEQGESESEPEAEPEAEGMEYEERVANAEADANAHWQSTVSRIEAGEADAYLDQLQQADDRPSVQSAIEARREEL